MINSTVKFSKIEDRLDAEYYKPEYINLRCLFNAQTKKLEDVAENLSGYAFPSEWFREDAGIPTVKMSQITSDWVVNLQNAKYLPMTKKEEFKEFLVCKNDVLVALTGATIGNSAIYIDDQQSLLNQRVQAIRAKNVSPYYLLALLSTKCFKNYIDYLCGGGARQNISPKDVIKFPLLANDISEKISDIIKEAILKRQLARQKYQEARELINKFLKIDNQKLNFKNCFSLPFSKIEDRIDGGYYQALSLLKLPMFKQGSVPLGDLATISAGKTPAKQTYAKKGVKILKARDLTNQGINWKNTERAYIKPEIWQKIKKAQVQKDDILVLSAAHQAHYIGKHIDILFDIPEQFNDKLSAVAELLIIRSQKINPYILLWYLRTKIGYLLIQRLITGETSHLYPKDLINLPVPKILLNLDGSDIANKTKQSMLLQKESKNLLEQAKQEVEKLIEK